MVWTPDRAAMEELAAAYPGEPVPVEYAGTRFSKAGPDTALEKAEDFFLEHPEIPLIHSSATHMGKYPYGISGIRNPNADVDS